MKVGMKKLRRSWNANVVDFNGFQHVQCTAGFFFCAGTVVGVQFVTFTLKLSQLFQEPKKKKKKKKKAMERPLDHTGSLDH